jgi:hypothetical protein
MTDVGELKCNGLAVSCANVSCGYYNPHYSNEYVVVKDVARCLALVSELCTDFAYKKWDHQYQGQSWDDQWDNYGYSTRNTTYGAKGYYTYDPITKATTYVPYKTYPDERWDRYGSGYTDSETKLQKRLEDELLTDTEAQTYDAAREQGPSETWIDEGRGQHTRWYYDGAGRLQKRDGLYIGKGGIKSKFPALGSDEQRIAILSAILENDEAWYEDKTNWRHEYTNCTRCHSDDIELLRHSYYCNNCDETREYDSDLRAALLTELVELIAASAKESGESNAEVLAAFDAAQSHMEADMGPGDGFYDYRDYEDIETDGTTTAPLLLLPAPAHTETTVTEEVEMTARVGGESEVA